MADTNKYIHVIAVFLSLKLLCMHNKSKGKK
jgi:hypothetical protein